MQSFWDSRYAEDGFAYGSGPNHFLREKLHGLTPGKILFPAEGQARNAVYAGGLGWDVHAFDNSAEGRKTGLAWAAQNGVSINYTLADYATFEASEASFDCIAMIYAHMPAGLRETFHGKLVNWLKPNGVVILEAFSVNQLGKESGGPGTLEMLYTTDLIRADFAALSRVDVWEEEVMLDEGKYHVGEASVIRMFGIR